MSRPLRIAFEGAWYHVMNRGLAHKPIFLNDDHRKIFLKILSETHERFLAEIHAYCLMNNHYHLLIRTPLGNISRVMRHLDGVYTQKFNKLMGRDGPLFRGRFKSILVEADAYLLQLGRYIHLNPVKAKITATPEQYIWSSYRSYLSGNPPLWLNIRHTLSFFSSNGQNNNYQSFMTEKDSEIENYFLNPKKIPILGTDKFIQLISEKYLENRHKINEIPEHKTLEIPKKINFNHIIDCVAKFFNISHEEILSVRKKTGNEPRAITMYLAYNIGNHNFVDIASHLMDITPAGVARACQRLSINIKNKVSLEANIQILNEMIMSFVQT